MEYAIAVIDIGMTNKKAAVYDDTLRQLDAKYRNFEPKITNGLPAHDLDAMEAWFIDVIKEFAAKYPVKAVAVSTHGATFVCLGKDGKPALPCLYYTHEPGDDFYDRFYRRFGNPEALQERTGTPAFRAMINPAKGIFFAREQFPDAFRNVTAVLPYPQYWGFRFTGKMGTESTYMGNHTYLWDQVDNTLSSVARDLGIAPLIPGGAAGGAVPDDQNGGSDKTRRGGLSNSWDVLGTVTDEFAGKTGLAKDTIVTMGIHDSNSALLPHFAKKGERGFILNSTGTWCVIMNPVEKYGFAPNELGKVVFFNISAFGTPVKTAIFLGGQEFETWSKLITTHHGRKDFPGWDEPLYRSILAEKRLFLLPELTPGSGQFPASRARIVEDGRAYPFEGMHNGNTGKIPPCFADFRTAFAILRISLVMQTLTALERTGLTKGRDLYTEGGFRRDESYNRLLSSALKDNRAFLTDIAEATALGAAMTAKMALGGKALNELAGDFEIDYREVEKQEMDELYSYRKAWTALAEG
ncbi:MAG: carbohydrate kinase [Treponema sp.]|jgi:sugar (pentulose or hexulose) kinase|nr:carbohydrate kinase [Treponema sp.]